VVTLGTRPLVERGQLALVVRFGHGDAGGQEPLRRVVRHDGGGRPGPLPQHPPPEATQKRAESLVGDDPCGAAQRVHGILPWIVVWETRISGRGGKLLDPQRTPPSCPSSGVSSPLQGILPAKRFRGLRDGLRRAL